MLTAALSLTNCQKAEFTGPEAQKGGKTITLSATALQMKTTNDGLRTLWASGDNLTVFHAVHGTTEYVKDGQFTIGEGVGTTSGVFTVTPKEELTPGEHYDWYILKNGRPKLTSPNGSGVSYNVGEPRQAQAGFGSSAHIAGTDTYMMFGHIWNAAAEDDLAVALTHMNSLLKVQVTNATAAPIHIYNVEFVAKDDISGTAYVDFTKDDLVITSDASSNHASIGVTGTEALAAGATADFFIGIRPFTAKAGDVLELRVNGYPKKLTLTEDVTFAPGHEKVLTFSYDNTPGDLSGDYMIAGRYNGEMYAGYGIALAPGTYDGSGGNNPVMFAKKVMIVGDQIYYDGDMTISGSGALTIPTTIDNYKFKVRKVTEGEYAGLYTIQNYQDKYMTSTLEVDGNCIGFVETPEAGSYMDINANGENAVDGYRIVAAFAPSPNRRHFLFADKGGNWGRFLMSLADGLSILFILSKNQLLALLIFAIVSFVSFAFISALIFVIYFLLLILGFFISSFSICFRYIVRLFI